MQAYLPHSNKKTITTMKKIVLAFGLISGVIITGMMLFMANKCYTNPEFESNDVIGYALLIVAFSFIFVGIKTFRDKQNGGVIGFGKAFLTGLYISLVAATMYVVVWLFDYYLFMPDYLDKYSQHVMYMAKIGGANEQELAAKATEMATFAEMYQNPVAVVLITFSEVFPIGLIISLVSAAILKRKQA
jgi:putative flippase GtrA